MEPAPGRRLHVTDGYTVTAEVGHTWTAVERIRLHEDEVEAAVAEVDAIMREARTLRASWWVCERSAPDDLEERLLAAGCHRDDDDYLHAAMVLTREPARVEGVEARRLETPDERLEALAVQQAVFGVDVTSEPEYAAWVDGRIAAVGRTIWTRVGGYLIGGAGVGRRRSRSAPGRCRGRSSSGSLRAGAPAPSDRIRTLSRMNERCPRCSAEMHFVHGSFQCPRCKFKWGCCEGETAECRETPSKR